MDSPPDVALTLSYWLHMLGTVVWIGGLSTFTLLIAPISRRALEPSAALLLQRKFRPRLQAAGWFSLILLTGTGLLQMSANPNYEGFLAITNRWAVAILVKHLLFGLMIVISAYLTWILGPAAERAALRQAKQSGESLTAEAARLSHLELRLTWVNLVMAVLVLGLTALARIS